MKTRKFKTSMRFIRRKLNRLRSGRSASFQVHRRIAMRRLRSMPVRARYAIIACSVLGITMAIYQLAKPKQPVDESMLMPEIRTETLKPGTLIHEIKNPGTVTYLDKASVASRVLGRVQQIFVEQGSRVKKGEKLAQMETFEIILKQRQAQGSAAQARAQMLLAQARYSAARREVEKQLTG
ncbi:MAG TPA: biotin/lipoyl-binding protein, partial [Leptospiraceae bacterium]|nr:biotin/lipoyl-binding protein [Leptospiraceae bacterium]